MVQKIYIQVPFREAARIGIVCKCKTQALIDLRGNKEERKTVIQNALKQCSGCGHSFDSSFTEALVQFDYWLESAEKSGHEISLVIDG
jgi:hypothetical protein